MASEDQAYHQTTDKEIEFLEGVASGKWVREWTRGRALRALFGYQQTLGIRRWSETVDVDMLRYKVSALIAQVEVAV